MNTGKYSIFDAVMIRSGRSFPPALLRTPHVCELIASTVGGFAIAVVDVICVSSEEGALEESILVLFEDMSPGPFVSWLLVPFPVLAWFTVAFAVDPFVIPVPVIFKFPTTSAARKTIENNAISTIESLIP